MKYPFRYRLVSIHQSAWRDCMKSSWRSLDGGSSVAPNTKIESSVAVFCAWWYRFDAYPEFSFESLWDVG